MDRFNTDHDSSEEYDDNYDEYEPSLPETDDYRPLDFDWNPPRGYENTFEDDFGEELNEVLGDDEPIEPLPLNDEDLGFADLLDEFIINGDPTDD